MTLYWVLQKDDAGQFKNPHSLLFLSCLKCKQGQKEEDGKASVAAASFDDEGHLLPLGALS